MKKFDRRTLLRGTCMAAASLALHGKAFAWADNAPVATTTAGKISGALEGGINVFKGVPYGGDTAKTRFMGPVPPTPRVGVKEGRRVIPMAPQVVDAPGAPT